MKEDVMDALKEKCVFKDILLNETLFKSNEAFISSCVSLDDVNSEKITDVHIYGVGSSDFIGDKCR